MSRYITWADMAYRYKSLGRDFDSTQIDSYFIPYVEAQIEGMLAPVYTPPFSSNNLTVKDLSLELLYIKIAGLNAEDSEQKMDDLIARIDRLLKGSELMVLGDGTALTNAGNVTAWSSESEYHSLFDHGETINMVQDQEQVDDEEAKK